MREVRIVTVPLDPRTGLFDHGALRGYLADREVLRAEPHFFSHDGSVRCAVYLETRVLHGATPRPELPPLAHPAAGPATPPSAADAAFATLMGELDEVEAARYARIVQWRREAAHRHGLPHYVLCTNRQAIELARRAPRTLEELSQIKGLGKKTVQVHGLAMLEVLHGTEPSGRAERPAVVRTLDGDDAMAAGADAALSGELSPHAEPADRQPGAGDSGGHHDGGVPEAAGAEPADGQ